MNLKENLSSDILINTPSHNEFTQEEPFEPKSILEYYVKNAIFIKKRSACSVYDLNENKYLDMYAGICVKNLGENPTCWVDMVSKTASEAMHVGNYFFNKNEIRRASLLKEIEKESVPEAKVFFCNSGTKGNEAAIKFAILQNFSLSKKEGKILLFSGGFHGRTLGSLSCT